MAWIRDERGRFSSQAGKYSQFTLFADESECWLSKRVSKGYTHRHKEQEGRFVLRLWLTARSVHKTYSLQLADGKKIYVCVGLINDG